MKVGYVILILASVEAVFGLSNHPVRKWESAECHAACEDLDRGSGCVAPGSLQGICNVPCVFDEQCASGVCSADWKVCYEWGKSCSLPQVAQCGDSCSSKINTKLSSCKCGNSQFPNQWVKCPNGQYDNYNLNSGVAYQRSMMPDGSLRESDLFARKSVCRHNFFRQAAGVQAVAWDNDLASFATEWVKTLKGTNNCNMKHSTNAQRENLNSKFPKSGENLYWYQSSSGVGDFSHHAEAAADAWYGEVKFFNYGDTYNQCSMRNQTAYSPEQAQIGHMTQLLWDQTTHIGCDYDTCGGDTSIIVSCVYGPAGNFAGKNLFDKTAASRLNQWSYNAKWGGMPSCTGSLPYVGGVSYPQDY